MGLWSRSEGITIFGAFGGQERGWKEIGPRLSWASRQFTNGTFTREYLSIVVCSDLAYTVHIERIRARTGSESQEREVSNRITHIFSREGDGWRLTHRHADPLIEKTKP